MKNKQKIVLFANSVTNSSLINNFHQEVEAIYKIGLEFDIYINKKFLSSFTKVGAKKVYCSSFGPSSSRGIFDIIYSIIISLKIALDYKKIRLIHFTSVNIKNFIPMLAMKFLNVTVKSTIHDVVPHEGRPALDRLFNRILVSFSDEIVLYSEFSKCQFQQMFPKWQGILHVRKLGGYDRLFERKEEMVFSRKEKNRLLIFGRMEEYKGINVALELAEQFPEINFDFVGSGAMSEKIAQSQLPNISFEDRFIEDFEIGDIFEKYKFILLPYVSATQSGIVGLAHYFGVYPIATSVGALGEQIVNENLGLVGSYNEIKAFLVDLNKKDVDSKKLITFSKNFNFDVLSEDIKFEYDLQGI